MVLILKSKKFYFIKRGGIDQYHHVLCSKIFYFIKRDGIDQYYHNSLVQIENQYHHFLWSKINLLTYG